MLRQLSAFTVILATGAVSASASVDAGLLALVPPGSQIVAAVDISRARDSQFGQFLMARVNTRDSNFEQFLTETGFEPRRDLQDFVFAASGGSGGNGVILARGNFDVNRIEAAARAHGASIQTYRGVNLILNSARTHESAAAFLAPGIAVMADVPTIEAIIRNQSATSTLDPALQQLIASAGPSNDAWFVSISAGALAAPEVKHWNAAATGAVQSITEASGGIRFGDPIALTVDAVASSAQDASALANVIRGLVGVAQMQRQANPYLAVLASAADTMNLASDGNTIHLSLSIPEKDAEQLASFHSGPSHPH
jgi:hypothetical protein